MSTVAPGLSAGRTAAPERVRLYTHSNLLYWWPVWLTGYLLALLTYLGGSSHQIEPVGHPRELLHPSSNLGVVFFLVLYLVILFTSLTLRGLASGLAVLGGVAVVLVLAYLGWWDEIFSWFGDLSVHMTMGSYFWFSTLLFATWAGVVFGVDRATYWEVTAGQVTRRSLFGAESRSYNTRTITLERRRGDLFRHWLLGFGAADLIITTSGSTREQFDVPNVLLAGVKLETVQRLLATVPEAAAAE